MDLLLEKVSKITFASLTISCKQSTSKSVPVVGQVIPLTRVLVMCMLPLSFLLSPMYYPINLKQKHNLSNWIYLKMITVNTKYNIMQEINKSQFEFHCKKQY